MDFKLFGLTWSFKPVLAFVWFMLLLVLLCVFLVGTFDDNTVLAMVGFLLACCGLTLQIHLLVTVKYNDNRLTTEQILKQAKAG